jgi:hypothetical protein
VAAQYFKQMLEEEATNESFNSNTIGLHANIFDLKEMLPSVKVLYMYDEAFPPDLMDYVPCLIKKSPSLQWVVSFKHGRHSEYEGFLEAEAGLELVDVLACNKQGSGESSRAHLYECRKQHSSGDHPVLNAAAYFELSLACKIAYYDHLILSTRLTLDTKRKSHKPDACCGPERFSKSCHDSLNHDSMNHYSLNHDGVNHDSLNHDGVNHDSLNHDLVNHDLVNHDWVNHDWVNHDWVNHDLVNHDLVNHDLVNHDLVNHDLVNHDLVNHDLVNHDLVNHDSPPWRGTVEGHRGGAPWRGTVEGRGPRAMDDLLFDFRSVKKDDIMDLHWPQKLVGQVVMLFKSLHMLFPGFKRLDILGELQMFI